MASCANRRSLRFTSPAYGEGHYAVVLCTVIACNSCAIIAQLFRCGYMCNYHMQHTAIIVKFLQVAKIIAQLFFANRRQKLHTITVHETTALSDAAIRPSVRLSVQLSVCLSVPCPQLNIDAVSETLTRWLHYRYALKICHRRGIVESSLFVNRQVPLFTLSSISKMCTKLCSSGICVRFVPSNFIL